MNQTDRQQAQNPIVTRLAMNPILLFMIMTQMLPQNMKVTMTLSTQGPKVYIYIYQKLE